MSSRIFYYQNQSVVQKSAQGVQLFSRESKAGPSVRRQSMQEYQGISILFFSRQSKARDQHLVFLKSKQSKCGQDKLDSKMVDKSVDQERENQCKAEIFKIKETSSAQCPVGLKGRRPHAPRGPTVTLQCTLQPRRTTRRRPPTSCRGEHGGPHGTPRTPDAPRPRQPTTQTEMRRHPERPRGPAVRPHQGPCPSPRGWPP